VARALAPDKASAPRRWSFPDAFLFGGFGSLFGRFKSLFGRLGNLPDGLLK
jgi:hypothetical protein